MLTTLYKKYGYVVSRLLSLHYLLTSMVIFIKSPDFKYIYINEHAYYYEKKISYYTIIIIFFKSVFNVLMLNLFILTLVATQVIT